MEKHKEKKQFSQHIFALSSQWVQMDSCQANLGQRLALDQVPEITGPAHFLWVKVISRWGQNTDLESVTRLSWPPFDLKSMFL